jgi:hypothetical protein
VRSPVHLAFDENSEGGGRIMLNRVEMNASRGMTCVPIAAVLHVLNYKHVDLVALDTETTEPHILVCLDFCCQNAPTSYGFE